MPRIRDVLERESRTVDLAQGDFERLLVRRERKERDRRIRAGAVGVIVALGTGIILVRSLTSDEVPSDPPVEPRPAPAAAGTLAYILDGDIYVADPDGSNAVKIADGRSAEDCYGWGGEYWAEGSMWSPDGRYLAFRRYTDCGNEDAPLPRDVVITDTEGNVVASFPAQGWDIAWSPDSTRVAVWDEYFETAFTIGVYGVDGTRLVRITMPAGWDPSGDHDPVWTPDGASVIVNDLEVPLDGSAPRQLPFPTWDFAYSPDGSQVVHGARRSLVVARSDGSEPREVFGDWAGSPRWSPTGDRIAFTSGARDARTELRVVDLASGVVTLVTEGEPRAIVNVVGFSPQGDHIVFSRVEDEGRGEGSLWSVGVDGSDARLLVAGTVAGDVRSH